MTDQSGIIIIALLIIFFVLAKRNGGDDRESFSSTKSCNQLDGRCYDVSTKYDEETYRNASEMLAECNRFAISFLTILRNKYMWDNKGNEKQRDAVSRLMQNYNPDNTVENAPTSDVNTSYVKNKGEVFAICLREAHDKNNFHKKNIMRFVMLHEMAHLSCPTWGHDQPFWSYFKFLLIEAVNNDMYDPTDYGKHNENYCGLILKYNPFFDKGIPSI